MTACALGGVAPAIDFAGSDTRDGAAADVDLLLKPSNVA